MKLGCFSISLAVKDLAASKAFYEKLGFTKYAGDEAQHYLIMKNGQTNIGLFEGMFKDNIMTFNPGWNQDADTLDEFTDVRELQQQLKRQGIEMMQQADEAGQGPGHCVFTDPDGNVIMLDQHV